MRLLTSHARAGRSLMPCGAGLAIAAAVALAGAMPAHANLVIDPTFDTTITSDPQASTIESSINAAIGQLESDITTPLTVNIDFQEGGGLGESSKSIYNISYSTYLAALTSHATSADDFTALASLGVTTNNPVNGQQIWLTQANARELGLVSTSSSDGTILLNTSLMNLSRSGTQDPSKYDIEAVALHEMDEVLGFGSLVGSSFASSGVLPQDLFRYSAPNVRSFATGTGVNAYFSINGGATDIVNFNQSGGGADYGDWASSLTNRVQDAFGTPGVDLNLGPAELTDLDVIGYTLSGNATAAPEPGSLALLAGVMVPGVCAVIRRRRQAC